MTVQLEPTIYAVRVWFVSGKIYTKVFSDKDSAIDFANNMINRTNVDNAELWEM